MNSREASRVFGRSRVGLLTTYRRNGEPVSTPVSIAVRPGGIYFVSSATSGKARRLAVRPDVTLAPSTVRGQATGPATSGQATLRGETKDRRVRRLLRPGSPLFWSYVFYRLRGHRMQVYEVHLSGLDSAEHRKQAAAGATDRRNAGGIAAHQHPTTQAPHQKVAADRQPQVASNPAPGMSTTSQLYRAVHLTARASALLFAGSQATAVLDSRARHAARPLYVGFMAAHAVHFAMVARYAQVTGGRNLFPGGRSMSQVGGWPTVLAIFTLFAGLAATGWAAGAYPNGRPRRRALGRGATGVITAMYAGVYLGQVGRSRWYALPAAVVAGATTANILSQRRHRRRH